MPEQVYGMLHNQIHNADPYRVPFDPVVFLFSFYRRLRHVLLFPLFTGGSFALHPKKYYIKNKKAIIPDAVSG